MIKFVEAREFGKWSASRLLDTPSVNVANSTYRRNKQQEVRTRGVATTKPRPDPKSEHTFDSTTLCWFCAQRGHGKNPSWSIGRSKCPSYGKQCGKCKNMNHVECACLSKASTRRPTKTSDEQFAAFELCTMVNGPVANVNTITLDHHLYDNLCVRWHKRASDPQPYVRVCVRAFEEDYCALGFSLRKRISGAELPAMADTGCQSCLMGIQVAQGMGFNADDLIPVTMMMRAGTREGFQSSGRL